YEKPKIDDVPSPTFGDLPIELGYAYTFVDRPDGMVLRAGPRAAFLFPTSPESQGGGVHGTMQTELVLDAAVPLLRGEALNGVFVRPNVGWSHLFSDATTPVDRNPVTGRSEQLSGHYFVRNRLSLGVSYWLNVWGDLSLGNAWGIGFLFRDTPSG